MYNITSELQKINQNYDLTGFKQQDGYMFYGNIKLNHKYNNIILKNELYISMFVPSSFPEKLPIVKDIMKKIDGSFHKNENDILCLACDTEMYFDLKRKVNVTISDFIERFLIPYLYSYTYYKKYGKVPFGDRDHGVFGVIDFYKEYFNLKDRSIALHFLEYMALRKYRGHNLCLCGSGKKVRNCHGSAIITLMETVGIDNLLKDYNMYLDFLKLYAKQEKSKKKLEYKKMQQQKRLNYYLFPPKSPFEISIPKFYQKYLSRKVNFK